MNLNDELAICLFVLSIRRLHPLADRIDKPIIEGLNEFQQKTYYPNLTKDDISKVNDFIDYWKNEITNSMLIGLLMNDEGGKYALDTLKGIAGIDTEGIELIKQMKRDLALGRVTITPELIESVYSRLFNK